MDNTDFRQVILDQKNGIDKNLWTGKMLDYLYMVKENPDIAIFAPGRIYNMIMSKGTEKIDESYKIRGYEDLVKYSFFNDRIYGCYNAIHDIMKFLKASSRRTETGKRILILVGPVSSGKSTIATLFKRGLEEYNLQKFAVKGCPLHEEPLHLIPIKDRPYWEEVLGVKIEGHLCPVCLQHMEENNVAWEDMMVTEIKFSEQKRMGVGTFSPSDPKCVKYDTYLLSDKGLMEFSEIYEKIRGNVFSTQDDLLDIDINVDGIDGIEKTSKFYNNGIQKTLDIKTKMQYEISVTETHPLLVFQDGKQKWVKAIDLSIGDYIGLKRGQMMFGNVDKLPMFNYTGPTPKGQNIDMVFPEKLTPPLAKVLGYLVSEGSHDKYSVWFSNNDTHLLNDFKINFESVFGIKPKTYSRDNGKRTSSCNSISSVKLCSFLDQVCGIKHGAENKDIPKIIRTSSKENILAFLEGLFWGDGTISSRREVGSNYFGYSSKSKKMIDQLQIILLNFGIVSSKYTYHHKKGFISHGLSVRSNDVLDLIKFIPSLENKKTDKGSFIEEKDNSNWNVIPGLESVFNEIILKIRDRVGPIYKIPELSQLYRYSLGQRMPRRSSVVQLIENLRKICPGLEETSYLDELVNNNIIWLPIIDIQDGGYQQVYDITVPKTHSFCANGFINHNSQDVSELIGRVNLAKISRYGETDPRAYQFDGELDIANGGMLELIELLKVDTKLLYVFITVAQEQVVKSPGFPQIYIDELLLAHSVVGDEPIPYRKEGKVQFKTMRDLVYDNDTNIEVLAMNLNTKMTEWTKVKGFHKHTFSGKVVKTIQRDGIIETTHNHSLYSTDYETFYPLEMKDILTVRNIPKTENLKQIKIDIPEDMFISTDGYALMKPINGCQGNCELKKNKIKAIYGVTNKHIKSILKIFAWYITEGHIVTHLDKKRGVVISQNNVEELELLSESTSKITTSKCYVNNRSNKLDKTSRLQLYSAAWSTIMEHNCGRYSENKKMPNFIFNLPNELKEYFINELVKGDGCFTEFGIRYKTTSKMLAAQFGFLMSQLGRDYGVYFSYTKTDKECYDIVERKKTKSWLRVGKIENQNVVDEEVYDIECIGNHSFVCGVGMAVCHNTNLTEFDAFKSDKKNEALHDRIYPIMVPWNTVVNDEIKIYEKMIRESDFRNIHIAPGTLKIAAQFAVLTRLAQSTKIPSLLDKMKLYNGEITEEVRKQDIDIKSLREEGKEKGEGMFGISPRFIINALNVALGMKEDKMCINPIDIIRALRENFDHHMGITNEEKSKYLDLLIGEKDSVRFEFNQFALKEVNMAFLVAYEEQAQSLFDNYVINAQAFCKNERVFDSILQEYSDPDEKLMRSIEELVGVPVNSKKEFRNNLFVYKATLLEQGKPFTFRDYTPLKDAIEKKLVSDLKNIVSLTIADKTITNEKVKKRRKDAIDNLIEKGYCKLCAENLLAFVGESIRKGT